MIEIFEISPFSFYKIIEVFIKAEDGLSRDVVKHLNHVSCRWPEYQNRFDLFPVVKKLLAPFHPLQPNICMHSLHTVLYTFLKDYFTIESFFQLVMISIIYLFILFIK